MNSKDARSLVEQLGGDFIAQGKRSCRDCLRSKAMPSSKVMSVVESPDSSMLLSQDVLVEAQSIVTQNLSCILDNGSATALSHMDAVATAVQFAQLVLYLPQSSKPRQPLSSDPSNVGVSEAPSPERLDQLIHTVLMNISQSISRLLEQWNTRKDNTIEEEDLEDAMRMDASATKTDARPVACFAFVSILRLQHFCRRRQQWMIPLCKSLCDLATVASKSNAPLPVSLVEDAIRSLTKLLEEGTMVLVKDSVSRWMPSTATTSPPLALDHHTFFAKFVSFLVARVVALLSLLPDNGGNIDAKSMSWGSLWKILTTLSGLPLCIRFSGGAEPAPNDASHMQNYSSIGGKTEKQVLKILFTDRINGELLQGLLQTKVKRLDMTPPVDSVAALLRSCRLLGRAILLQRFMQKVSKDGNGNFTAMECDLLLKVCEIYHSTALPQCFGILSSGILGPTATAPETMSMYLMVPQSVQDMSTLILQVETTLRSTDPAKCSQLHRLLVRWMSSTSSPAHHPFADEFVLSLLVLYLLRKQYSKTQTLATLMVKLLFDPRTNIPLRRNLSRVLMRIMDTSTSPDYVSSLSHMVEQEFAECWKEFLTSYEKVAAKKKRKIRDLRSKPIAFQVHIFRDVVAIGRVLAKLTPRRSELLQRAVNSLVQEDALKRIGHKQVATQLKSISLLLWYVLPQMRSHDIGLPDSNCVTLSLLEKVVQSVIQQLKPPVTDKCLINYTHLCYVALNLCRAACANPTMQHSSVSVPEVGRLISGCTAKAVLSNPHKGSNDETETLRYRIILEGISLLGSLGKAIPESCPTQTLEMIRDIFHRVLTAKDAAIVRSALSSLAQFGHNLSSAHVRHLPTFLPKDRIPQFQARNQGMIWKNSQHTKIDNTTASFQRLGLTLENWIDSRSLDKNIFPMLSSLHIVSGSYLLQMPTQGGRQALVIFPPGDQSLDDIRQMRDSQDDDESPKIQTLKRVVVLPGTRGEEGCKFLLAES